MRAIFLRMYKGINDQEEGITGLETAIILIAFVIVASVFAYVVLSAGLYSSQKTKQAVNAGLESTMSTIELKGDIIASMSDNVVHEIYLYVGIPAAGTPVDFTDTSNSTNKVVISYSDADTLINSANWTLAKLSTINTDNLLDANELFMVTVDLSVTDNISAYDQFTLSLRPPDGPTLSIERTIPGRVAQYVNLH
ncbi:archaellin/type IV pilin N-terminal domain-containing protein [Chloroflexota bacterium]